MHQQLSGLDSVLLKLESAVSQRRSQDYCLRLWSDFIRLRDNRTCVLCGHRRGRRAAHHIVRKSFWAHLQFQPGNGITLCRRCHKEPHAGFNRRPDLHLPMDAEGGEKIDLLTGLLHALIIDAERRGMLKERYYHFDDRALQAFKKLQGIPVQTAFEGSSLDQAYSIWSQTPRGMLKAVLGSMGVTIPDDYVQTEPFTVFHSETDGPVLYARYIPTAPLRQPPEDADLD